MPGLEADHSSPSSAMLKMSGILPPLLSYAIVTCTKVTVLFLNCLLRFIGYWKMFCPWEKLLGFEADHSPLFSVDVTNAWKRTFTPPYSFMMWYLIKKEDWLTCT